MTLRHSVSVVYLQILPWDYCLKAVSVVARRRYSRWISQDIPMLPSDNMQVYVCVCMCMCMCVWVCVWACVCLCVCAHLCTSNIYVHDVHKCLCTRCTQISMYTMYMYTNQISMYTIDIWCTQICVHQDISCTQICVHQISHLCTWNI